MWLRLNAHFILNKPLPIWRGAWLRPSVVHVAPSGLATHFHASAAAAAAARQHTAVSWLVIHNSGLSSKDKQALGTAARACAPQPRRLLQCHSPGPCSGRQPANISSPSMALCPAPNDQVFHPPSQLVPYFIPRPWLHAFMPLDGRACSMRRRGAWALQGCSTPRRAGAPTALAAPPRNARTCLANVHTVTLHPRALARALCDLASANRLSCRPTQPPRSNPSSCL